LLEEERSQVLNHLVGNELGRGHVIAVGMPSPAG